jgi:hypothetical protein
MDFSSGRTVALSKGYIINPLVTSDNPGQEGSIIGGGLTKFLAEVDMLLFLICCQKLHQDRYTTPNKRT